MPTMEGLKVDAQYAMFTGEPGTRKSTAALSYPRPQYWFSYDQKMEALVLPMRNWGISPKEITYDNYTDWNKARTKLEQFQIACPFKTIIIDSITSMGDAINRQTLKVKTGTTTQSGGEAGKRIGGISVNTIEDFNAETSAFQELIALTKDICNFHKVNVILIAHVIRTEEKDNKGIVHVARSIVTGGKKIGAKMPAYAVEIYHFNLKSDFDVSRGGNYALLTQHSGENFGRTCLPLPMEIAFGDQQLYDKFVKPAIDKLNAMV